MNVIRTRVSMLVVRFRSSLSIAILTLALIVVATADFAREVAAKDQSTRSGSSASRLDNNPPSTPVYPDPPHLATGVMQWQYISWLSHEPDGDELTYDIYEGTDPNPPLIKTNHTVCCGGYAGFSQPAALPSGTQIYWRVVAKDPYGGETSSPVWNFTTRANTMPVTPHDPVPPADAPGYSSSNVDLKWSSGDADYQPLTYDIYFGTDADPPLVAGDYPSAPVTDKFYWKETTHTYPAGPFTNGTRYYWKIVARDPEGGESTSPVWTFVADENEPPTIGDTVMPAEGATAGVLPSLTWSASDPNLDELVYKLYLGPTNPPPLAAENLTSPAYNCGLCYKPQTLLTGTTYYWYVVASDGVFEATGPTHSFSTVPPGDVTRDGVITAHDATCVLNLTVFAVTCTNEEGKGRADANCDGVVTPADARCIHKSVVDGSCAICSGGTAPPQVAPALTPVVGYDAWIDYDTLKVMVNVSNLPSLKSFKLSIESAEPFLGLTRVFRRGATSSFQPLNTSGPLGSNPFPFGPPYQILVAGYTLGDIDCTSETQFLEMHFYLPDHTFNYLTLKNFVDDLAGAQEVTILGTQTPVLFSSFTAVPRAGGGVDVAWELQSDEAMESYTLYRRDGAAASPRAITQGPVTTTAGSYFDNAVQSGIAYQYELAIKTVDGDVFRSPIAKVSATVTALALHQNHPNPFNPQTTIRYDLPGTALVRLSIFDARGGRVRTLVDEVQPAGSRSAVWNGRDAAGNPVSSGVYFYVLDAGKDRLTRKLVLLK